jgi:1,2-diacylglycerol 3-alpha-glucosyltransferase
MAAGVPVVALNASGVREVVRDDVNGFMLPADATPEQFAAALSRITSSSELRARLSAGAQNTAKEFSRERSAQRALAFYEEVRRATRARRLLHHLHPWAALVKRLGLEWDLLSSRTQTVAAAVFGDNDPKAEAVEAKAS